MHTATLTTGELLRLTADRSGYDFQDIATACAAFEDASRSMYRELIEADFETPPAVNSPNRKVRRRLYVLCLMLDLDPADFGLTADDRLGMWPPDKRLRVLMLSRLKKVLASGQSAWIYTATAA